MSLDVYADLNNLFMLNFSTSADALQQLLPKPLTALRHGDRGFPSIVLPSIRNLRPVLTRFPRVHYELYGLRILVEYQSTQLGLTKGIYFDQLIMDPNWVRVCANQLTEFDFQRGTIKKIQESRKTYRLSVHDHQCRSILSATATMLDTYPERLTEHSSFSSPQEALAMYNDIAYGFLPDPKAGKIHLLQIADPHPNYDKWPLHDLDVTDIHVEAIHGNPIINQSHIILEPSYYIEPIPRYWRWLSSEPLR